MGWDICSIGNHRLDTSSINVLAKQLSEIFKINISCKAFNQYTDEKIDLGEVVYNKNAEWFTLWDEFYFAKSFYNKTSKVNQKRIYKCDLEDIESVKRGLVSYSLGSNRDVGKKDLYELCFADIMKDFISFSIVEPFRWFSFLDNLKKEKPSDYFLKYRQKNTDYYKKVGATEIVYFPDQGTAQLILDKFSNSLWEEIKEYALEKKYYADYLSSCINSNSKNWELAKKEYEEKDKCLVVNLSETLRNEHFFSSEDYIEVLYDDLSGLS
ncbi:MAG: hypothetical protein Q4A00_06695 [Flavobacteriaceae bacterium]|nr:hypothetical protein [Flavobacteriaceae bacterium]